MQSFAFHPKYSASEKTLQLPALHQKPGSRLTATWLWCWRAAHVYLSGIRMNWALSAVPPTLVSHKAPCCSQGILLSAHSCTFREDACTALAAPYCPGSHTVQPLPWKHIWSLLKLLYGVPCYHYPTTSHASDSPSAVLDCTEIKSCSGLILQILKHGQSFMHQPNRMGRGLPSAPYTCSFYQQQQENTAR